MKIEITQAIVRELLDYNARTGELTWRFRNIKWFKNEAGCNRWNARYAGKKAFTYTSREHKAGLILGQHHLAQRVIFLWVKGRWPTAIAYRNGDKVDNRWFNLVERKSAADARDYQRYRKGHVGVNVARTPAGNWVARIGPNYLGTYPSKPRARARRRAAAAMRWG